MSRVSMFLTASEAAETLGVSVTTLYTYVTRKRIRTHRSADSRARLYWREDIERLKHNAAPMVGDALVPRSAITLITGDGPYYRGQSAVRLAETATLEETCGLLWGPESAGAFGAMTFRKPPVYEAVTQGLGGVTIREKVSVLLPILERANPRSYDLSPGGYCRTGAELMRWFAGMICGDGEATEAPLHERIARGRGAPEGYADLVRRLFVLCADHELDPSTYAVRAVANTGSSAHEIVLAGIACSGGRRLSFGRAQALSAMITEILNHADPAEPILRRLREGEPIYGFGSQMYPQGDPRAAALLTALKAVDGDHPDLQRVLKAAEVAEEVLGQSPGLVIPLNFVGRRLGLAGQEGVLFHLARMGGWIAHAMEQYHSQDLVRSRTVYDGPLPELPA